MQIRTMQRADVAVGMSLGAQNGWNQLEGDWQRFLAMEPDGCFLAESNGKGIGTACACIFGSVAWVALVLVDASCRKQGIGTALMEHVLRFLQDRKAPTIRLDATPLGRPIYEKLGFAADYELARFEGVVPASPAVSGVENASTEAVDAICRLDLSMSGTERSKFLHRLYNEDPGALRLVRGDDVLTGYSCSRRGARATQVGPCMANAQSGGLLLADAFHRLAGQRVYVDIPLQNQPAAEAAKSVGLTLQRHLLRMTLGPRIVERVECLWASSGPEKG